MSHQVVYVIACCPGNRKLKQCYCVRHALLTFSRKSRRGCPACPEEVGVFSGKLFPICWPVFGFSIGSCYTIVSLQPIVLNVVICDRMVLRLLLATLWSAAPAYDDGDSSLQAPWRLEKVETDLHYKVSCELQLASSLSVPSIFCDYP